eukprot:CAMPEP_0175437892 /NCGR_PEP_ID=MMETSP0095-20121207/55725_1 /TAXON_ID=311494 /ORGANISM="Alexandrium monilatum, Strain CCMP3105" /LENGTH=129 /DNA_ID=CAMNT_0016737621 /DNA_START=147 /DNA_END=535 /DNA_ORIENTATION=+
MSTFFTRSRALGSPPPLQLSGVYGFAIRTPKQMISSFSHSQSIVLLMAIEDLLRMLGDAHAPVSREPVGLLLRSTGTVLCFGEVNGWNHLVRRARWTQGLNLADGSATEPLVADSAIRQSLAQDQGVGP